MLTYTTKIIQEEEADAQSEGSAAEAETTKDDHRGRQARSGGGYRVVQVWNE